MKLLVFAVDIKPIALARPRFGRGFVYTPKRCQDAKKIIALEGGRAMQGAAPFTSNISVGLNFYFKSDKGKFAPHVLKPDLDNLIKLVLDALTGVVWVDDCIISSILATKSFGKVDKIEVEVRG
jgi:Holliday junction resolvase RusA-like endonuclease